MCCVLCVVFVCVIERESVCVGGWVCVSVRARVYPIFIQFYMCCLLAYLCLLYFFLLSVEKLLGAYVYRYCANNKKLNQNQN
jgi:hypothetical protein